MSVPESPQSTNWRHKLYIIIFEADTAPGRLFDVVLFWAIILSVFSVLLESDPQIRAEYGPFLKNAEWFFTILFTIEFILRIVTVDKPLTYLKSFFGIVDFLAIAPTYLSLFVTGTQFLLVIRAIRLLRVFRVLKLARYLQESRVLTDALLASRAKITVFLGAVLTIVLIMGTIMYLVEQGNPGFNNIFKGMYWAIVTMTTVGYGDAVPLTNLGKFIASVLMIMGYGIIAVPTGIVSAELAQSRRLKEETRRPSCGVCNSLLVSEDANFCHHCGQSHA